MVESHGSFPVRAGLVQRRTSYIQINEEDVMFPQTQKSRGSVIQTLSQTTKKKSRRARTAQPMKLSHTHSAPSSLFSTQSSKTKPKSHWYCGYNTTYQGPPSPLSKTARNAAINRYGANSYVSQSQLTTSASIPSFLHLPSLLSTDGYRPPFQGSPSLWPMDKTQTKSDPLSAKIAIPDTTSPPCSRLQRILQKEEEEKLSVIKMAIQEKREQKKAFRETFTQLKSEKQDKSYEFVTRSGELGLRYWGGCTVMVTSGLQRSLQNRVPGCPTQPTSMAEVENRKWDELIQLHKIIRKPHNRRPGDLETLYVSLQQIANANQPYSINPFPPSSLLSTSKDVFEDGSTSFSVFISREQFIHCINQHYEDLDERQLHRLFSSFDPQHQDRVDYRKFVCSLLAMRNLTDNTIQKLEAFYDIYDDDNTERIHFFDIQSLFTVCSGTDEEKRIMLVMACRAFGIPMTTNRAAWSLLDRQQRFITFDKFKSILRSEPQISKTFEKQLLRRLPTNMKEEVERVKNERLNFTDIFSTQGEKPRASTDSTHNSHGSNTISSTDQDLESESIF